MTTFVTPCNILSDSTYLLSTNDHFPYPTVISFFFSIMIIHVKCTYMYTIQQHIEIAYLFQFTSLTFLTPLLSLSKLSYTFLTPISYFLHPLSLSHHFHLFHPLPLNFTSSITTLPEWIRPPTLTKSTLNSSSNSPLTLPPPPNPH